MKKYQNMVFPAIVFVLLSVVLSGSFILIERQLVINEQEQYQYMAANQINMIKNGLDTSLARVYTFKAMIKDHQGDTSFFDTQAKEIYDETVEQTGIRLKNIAIAPNGVVEKVYPISGNEAFVGFDFMDLERAGNAEAVAAYQKGTLVVTNPFELIQGGIGMGGRYPIFLEEDGEEVFWGLVTVTMDFEEILKVFQLDALTNMGAAYELWYEDEAGERVTLASSKNLPQAAVSYQFAIKNLTWYLDVAPQSGWSDYIMLFVGVAAIIAISMLVSVLLYDKTRIKKANEQLEYAAHRDGLTGCYSRQYVNSVLINRNSGRWKEIDQKYSIAILDIDHFKNVNDTYGHETGDMVIRTIAHILLQHIKEEKGDCVVRHGGDEFVLLYQNITKEEFSNKLAQILEEVSEVQFSEYPNLKLTLSAGGVHYIDASNNMYHDMIREADRKLYSAKENGRAQWIV